MDPIPLELPVRANEAAALAEVIFQQVEGRRLTDDLRNRASGRAGLLGLETIIPHMGSLSNDPIHPGAFFLAIDAVRGGVAKPYLLRIATSSAPSSGLFQKSILIGRMRPGGGREIVINTVPFDPGSNPETIRTFAREVDRLFLPKPSGAAFTLFSSGPDAFAAFKSVQQDTNLNVAGFAGDWATGVSLAIRSGWREGYSIPASPIVLGGETALDAVLARVGYTKLILDVARLEAAARKDAVCRAYDACVKANAGERWPWRRPDLEVSWVSSAEPTTGEEIASLLAELREASRPVQAVSPRFGSVLDAGMAEAIRTAGAAVSLSSADPLLDQVSKACGGRVHCLAQPGEDLKALVKRIRA